jgi:hypothetical protein
VAYAAFISNTTLSRSYLSTGLFVSWDLTVHGFFLSEVLTQDHFIYSGMINMTNISAENCNLTKFVVAATFVEISNLRLKRCELSDGIFRVDEGFLLLSNAVISDIVTTLGKFFTKMGIAEF